MNGPFRNGSSRAPLISVAEAEHRILDACPDWGIEEIPAGLAGGRVLAGTLCADRNAPPFHRVAMDGIALRQATWEDGVRRFRLAGIQAAGEPPMALDNFSSCIEVMTGAVLPHGCDSVVPVEALDLDADSATLLEGTSVVRGQHVHVEGSDRQAGDAVLWPGQRLNSTALAVAASVGAVALSVRRLPRVLIMATGSELVPPEVEPAPWQIRGSNGPALRAALESAGFPVARVELLADDPARLEGAIGQALRDGQVLVISGAVSMGRFDFVPGLLRQAGAQVLFHGVAQRPGKPLLAARIPGDPPRLIFALPGNPVSALICLHRYVLPALKHAVGRGRPPRRAVLTEPVPNAKALTLFLPVLLDEDANGLALANPRPTSGSGDFIPLAATDGFLELGPAAAQHGIIAAGVAGDYYPWS